jgi:hypothetical protein
MLYQCATALKNTEAGLRSGEHFNGKERSMADNVHMFLFQGSCLEKNFRIGRSGFHSH